MYAYKQQAPCEVCEDILFPDNNYDIRNDLLSFWFTAYFTLSLNKQY